MTNHAVAIIRGQKPAMTIAQFCDEYGFSRSLFFKLQRQGLGPPVIRITPKKVLIHRDDAEAWVGGFRTELSAEAGR